MFMYRAVVPVAQSLYRLSMVYPSLRLVFVLGRLSGRFHKTLVDSMGYDGSRFCVPVDSDLTPGVVISVVNITGYLEMRQRGFDVSAVRYEDLVARPLDTCRVILEFCRLPVSLAELAIKALDRDSHRNCIGARSIIGHFKEPQLTPHTRAKLNELLKRYGMPLIGEPDVIEGTLACC